MANHVSRAEFSRIAGVTKATVTNLCKEGLKAARAGTRIDLDHPDVRAYLKNRADAQTSAAKAGIDPLYEKAVAACREAGKIQLVVIQRALGIGKDRARKMRDMMAASNVKVTAPTPPAPAPEPEKAPHARGHVAARETKKASAQHDPEEIEIPENIAAFADMPLRQIIYKFGTDVRFLDWLKALKAIEDVQEKRLKNAEKVGELVRKDIIKKAVIDPVDAAFIRMLTDGAKSIAAEAVAMAKADMTVSEVEQMTEKKLASFIKPTKAKIIRGLRDA